MPLNFFATLDTWHWWTLAGILIILELISPGVFLLWLGIAAGMVGILLFTTPDLNWESQMVVFAVSSIVIIFLQYIWLQRNPIATDRPTLNQRGKQYEGRIFTLNSPIVNGDGKIQVDDTTWKIRGIDCETGIKVKVIGVDSTVLLVERI